MAHYRATALQVVVPNEALAAGAENNELSIFTRIVREHAALSLAAREGKSKSVKRDLDSALDAYLETLPESFTSVFGTMNMFSDDTFPEWHHRSEYVELEKVTVLRYTQESSFRRSPDILELISALQNNGPVDVRAVTSGSGFCGNFLYSYQSDDAGVLFSKQHSAPDLEDLGDENPFEFFDMFDLTAHGTS